jgi:ubiquinone/menaquinone biosynthesis C-methylase UbiE
LPLSGVNIVADLEKGLHFFDDASVDEIHSESFFEHIENLEALMREIVRVLKPGGRNYLFVPHFSNPMYYSDYTHRRFFGLYTFYYFSAQQDKLIRKVPFFYTDIRVRVVYQRLRFASSFRGVRFLKKVFEKVVNSSSFMQEFYEENLCNLVPCYGMDVIFEPDPKQ